MSQPNITRVKSGLIDPLEPQSDASPFRKSKNLTSPSARSSGAVTITFGPKVEVLNEKPATITAQSLEAYLSYPTTQTVISLSK